MGWRFCLCFVGQRLFVWGRARVLKRERTGRKTWSILNENDSSSRVKTAVRLLTLPISLNALDPVAHFMCVGEGARRALAHALLGWLADEASPGNNSFLHFQRHNCSRQNSNKQVAQVTAMFLGARKGLPHFFYPNDACTGTT